MRQKAVLYAILFAGLVICLGGATSSARADSPPKSTATVTREQIPVRHLRMAGRDAPARAAPLQSAWSIAESPVGYALTSVDMVSADDGWAVGYFGRDGIGTPYGETILRFDGSPWYEWGSWSSNPPLFSVALGATDEGWTVGSGGRTAHWDGSNWNPVDSPSSKRLYSVAMVSAEDGWAVGGSGSCGPSSSLSGVILRWDGGVWSQWGGDIPDVMLYAVTMVSTNDGWAVGRYCHFVMPSPNVDSVIMHWNGSAWNSVSSPTYQTLYSVAMVSATDGWIVGGNGVTLRREGGAWNEVGSPTTSDLNSVAMVSTDDGWAVGEDGVILHWDGGAWNEVGSPVTVTLNSVSVISAENAWAVGEEGVILHYAPVSSLVRVVGAGTADSNWNWKDHFSPGDSILWFITIANDSGADAQVELTYDVKGPNGEIVYYNQYTDTISPGLWYWGDESTVPEGLIGIHTFVGSGLYEGITSDALATYFVFGPNKVYLPSLNK